jgi:FlaA1/EpsC-like NDP-sugar epimerase
LRPFLLRCLSCFHLLLFDIVCIYTFVLLSWSFECIKMVAEKIRRVAVIGAGPSGAITVDALVQEQAFDQIRVFDRQEGPGGCW